MTIPENFERNRSWLQLEAHINERIDTLRRKNDGTMPIEATSHLRGGLCELKRLLRDVNKTTEDK